MNNFLDIYPTMQKYYSIEILEVFSNQLVMCIYREL